MHKFIAIKPDIDTPVKNIGFRTFLVAITLLSFSSLAQNNEHKINVVVIDPGHGGRHPGTSGAYTVEKDLTLKVGLKVGAYIEEFIPGVKVIYTRKGDVTLGLEERAKIAIDNNADAFISIHANSLPESVPKARKDMIHGTETYVMGLHVSERNFEVAKRENSVILLEENYKEKYQGFDPNSPESYILFSLNQSAYQDASIILASKIEEQFNTRAGRKSHGVKQAGFMVLWLTTMPSVLVEIGFLSNTKEERELNTEETQDYIASAIYRAFKEFKSQMESIN